MDKNARLVYNEDKNAPFGGIMAQICLRKSKERIENE